MNLWPVEHFFTDQHWYELIWKKSEEKSVQMVRRFICTEVTSYEIHTLTRPLWYVSTVKHAIAVMPIRFEFWMFKKYLICTVFPVLIRLVQNWFFFLVIKICFSTYMRAACDLHNLYLYESFFWAKTIWPPRSSYTLKHFISIDAM